MRILRTNRGIIEQAAEIAGVQLYNFERITKTVESYKVSLRPKTEQYRKYGMHSYYVGWASKPRRVWAICYHGHYHFMRVLFELNKKTRIRSSHASFDTIEQLRSTDLAWKNIGSQIYPVYWEDSCMCESNDIDRAYYEEVA